jgi:hypothetical protein
VTTTLWEEDGHLTAEAAGAAGDGQLADGEVLAHLRGCDRCLRVVGLAARRSRQVDQLLRLAPRERLLEQPRPPSRRLAMAAAAALMIGAFAAGRLSAVETPAGTGAPLDSGPLRTPARLQLDGDLAGRAPPIGELRLQLVSAGEPSWRRGGCPEGGLLQ